MAESAGIGPVVLKLVALTGAVFLGVTMDQLICASLFPHLPLVCSEHVRCRMYKCTSLITVTTTGSIEGSGQSNVHGRRLSFRADILHHRSSTRCRRGPGTIQTRLLARYRWFTRLRPTVLLLLLFFFPLLFLFLLLWGLYFCRDGVLHGSG